jgi:type I restriction enzyme S subunit
MKDFEITIPHGWARRSVKELGNGLRETVQTGPFGSQLHAEDYVEDGTPLLLIRNMEDGRIDTQSLPMVDPSDAKRLHRYCLKPGDLVFSRVGRVGSCFLATPDNDGWLISGQLLRVRISNGAIDNSYIYRALISEYSQRHILGESVGTTRTSINTKILESLLLLVPDSKHEQAKIAEILMTVDRAIEQTEALIAKQERIKTGLMQDLLTRGIDEHGNLRSESTHQFKDSPLGRIPVEWNYVAIGTIARVRSGTTPLRSNPAFWREGTIPWVKTGEIDFSEISNTEEMVTTHALGKTSLHLEPVGTVLIAMYGQGGTRGRCGYLEIEATTNQACAAIFGSKERVNQRYLYQYLVSQYSSLRMIGHGSNQVNLSGRILAGFAITLPSIREQNRLSECFTRVDMQIKECRQQHYKLRSLKDALMQDLLTGRKRVTPLLELEPTR